jgi:hypothetical protein
MEIRTMDALSDWDDWSEDAPEWWLQHPLHRPRKRNRPNLQRHLDRRGALDSPFAKARSSRTA